MRVCDFANKLKSEQSLRATYLNTFRSIICVVVSRNPENANLKTTLTHIMRFIYETSFFTCLNEYLETYKETHNEIKLQGRRVHPEK